MSQAFDNLIKSFDKAIEKRAKDKFSQEDIDEIYQASKEAFDVRWDLDQSQIDQIRDKWVKLAEGHIDKAGATRKLQGTSRAEAIRSVLKSLL